MAKNTRKKQAPGTGLGDRKMRLSIHKKLSRVNQALSDYDRQNGG